MAEISPELKAQGSKAFWILTIVLLGAWFYNEAMTTQRTLREESSLIYSNLVGQFKNLYVANVGANEEIDKNTLDAEKRFDTEVTRLSNDFDNTPYSNFGRLLSLALDLSKNQDAAIGKLPKYADISNSSLELLEKEISSLLKARALISTKEDLKIGEGKKILLELIKTGKIVNIDAATSYFLSFQNSEQDILVGVASVKEVLKNKPELKETAEQEFSRFGIFVDLI